MSNSSKKQKQYTAAEKTKVALEAIRGELTLSQISSKYGIHTTQISNWKKQALELMQQGFTSNAKIKSNDDNNSELVDKLYKQIGKLSTECEWLKKNLNCLSHDKRNIVCPIVKTNSHHFIEIFSQLKQLLLQPLYYHQFYNKLNNH